VQTLIPNASDVAWTDAETVFDPTLSPGADTGYQNAADAVNAQGGAGGALGAFPSEPNAPGDRDWSNPTSATPTPITASSGGVLLGPNPKRNLLIIQNNSASGGATFWVSFNFPAVPGQCIGLAPGQALVLDYIVPRDTVYLTITGAAGATQGTVIEGSYSPGLTLARNPAYGTALGMPARAPSPIPVSPATVAYGYVPPPQSIPSGVRAGGGQAAGVVQGAVGQPLRSTGGGRI
jgi:hypothetical protein